MVQGRNITAEIEAPQTVEIPRKRRNVDVVVRISLHNNGEDDFVAHAASDDDSHFWHVLDRDQKEVMRQKKRGKGGVKVYRGVHSYRTETVAGGHGVHDQHTLTLDGRKLAEGQVYTIRGEIFGHGAETSFVAVNEASPRPKKGRKKKAGGKAKKSAAKKQKAAPKRKKAPKKKAAPRKKAAAGKRRARTAKKK